MQSVRSAQVAGPAGLRANLFHHRPFYHARSRGSAFSSARQKGRRGVSYMARACCIAALLLSPLLQADDTSRNAMADAMTRMMEAMGFLGDDKPSGMMPMDPSSLTMPGMMPGMIPGMGQFDPSQFARQPWSSAMQNPAKAFGMDQMMDLKPQLPSMPGWQRTGLDGIWEGRAGGLLIVRSHRFRLYSTQGYVDGLIQQRGDRIALYDPLRGTARPYEFAEHQGRLVLRAADGQVYLYRRLWLDEGIGADAGQGFGDGLGDGFGDGLGDAWGSAAPR